MNKIEFKQIMERIQGAYQNRFAVSDETRKVWYECLQDLEFETAREALTGYIRVSEFPPTVADLRKRYTEIEKGRRERAAEIDKLFQKISNFYPNGHYDRQARKVFYNVITQKEDKDLAAREIYENTVRFVRGEEMQGASAVPTLSEFLRKLL